MLRCRQWQLATHVLKPIHYAPSSLCCKPYVCCVFVFDPDETGLVTMLKFVEKMKKVISCNSYATAAEENELILE